MCNATTGNSRPDQARTQPRKRSESVSSHLTLSAGYLMYESSAADRHVRPPQGPYANPNPCPPYIHTPALENPPIDPSPPPRSTPPRPSPNTHDHQIDNSPSHLSSPVSQATMSPNGASGPVSHHCCEESETCCCSARRSARRSCSGGRGRRGCRWGAWWAGWR